MSKIAQHLVAKNSDSKSEHLSLQSCNLLNIPSEISGFYWLTDLNLSRNPLLTDLTPLVGLNELINLEISYTGITDLSPLLPLINKGVKVTLEKYTGGICVAGCPLTNPPIEIIQSGGKAILNYFEEKDQQGVDVLFEAKLILIGEGGAGKTSLYRRLDNLPLPVEVETTKGIEIHKFEFPLEGNRKFRLNIWDFGGQEIYHSTHQFFLTKRSLYILIDDTKNDHKTIHDEGFKYWLEVVETLSEKSPVLIFQNEKGGRSKQIDQVGIKRRFDNVKEFYCGNLEFPASVDKIKDAIIFYAQQLPHIGEALPKKWISIRNDLEELAKSRSHISQKRYFKIYRKHLPKDKEKALYLSRYLHDLGVFLHFQDDKLLSRTVILQNTWATEAVYKILDDEQIKSNYGHFTEKDCSRIWSGGSYSRKYPELLALMSKFELCYKLPVPDVIPETWLAPQLLQASKPDDLFEWDKPSDLLLRYEYQFLPKGLVNRLMVRQHRFVKDTKLAWRDGVLFERNNTHVLVEILYPGNIVNFRSYGPECKEMLSIISADLDTLNDSFEGIRGKVKKKIPCKCRTCANLPEPYYFDFDVLVNRKLAGKLTIECNNLPFYVVNVKELLDGISPFEGIPIHEREIIDELLSKSKVKEALKNLKKYSLNAADLLAIYNDAHIKFLSNQITYSEFAIVHSRTIVAIKEILEQF